GHIDAELTDRGRSQAGVGAAALRRFDPGVIIASDLRRAADTANVLSTAIGVPVSLDKRLRETHLGTWQGSTSTEIERDSPLDRERWRVDPTFAPPGGESRIEVADRSTEVVADLLRQGEQAPTTALLAAHGGVITALTARLVGFEPDSWAALGGIDNCHWVQLTRFAQRWRLRVYNAGVAE